MTKKEFQQLADFVGDLNVEFPFSGEIVQWVEKRIESIVRKEKTFDRKKWDKHIARRISDKMTDQTFDETNIKGRF